MNALMNEDDERCERPPPGWHCNLTAGHDGPCPTWKDAEPAERPNDVGFPWSFALFVMLVVLALFSLCVPFPPRAKAAPVPKTVPTAELRPKLKEGKTPETNPRIEWEWRFKEKGEGLQTWKRDSDRYTKYWRPADGEVVPETKKREWCDDPYCPWCGPHLYDWIE